MFVQDASATEAIPLQVLSLSSQARKHSSTLDVQLPRIKGSDFLISTGPVCTGSTDLITDWRGSPCYPRTSTLLPVTPGPLKGRSLHSHRIGSAVPPWYLKGKSLPCCSHAQSHLRAPGTAVLRSGWLPALPTLSQAHSLSHPSTLRLLPVPPVSTQAVVTSVSQRPQYPPDGPFHGPRALQPSPCAAPQGGTGPAGGGAGPAGPSSPAPPRALPALRSRRCRRSAWRSAARARRWRCGRG